MWHHVGKVLTDVGEIGFDKKRKKTIAKYNVLRFVAEAIAQ